MSKPDRDSRLVGADIQLFESGNFADATIVCGDRTWKVHKLILSSRSKWFMAAFHGNMAEAASGKVVLQEQDAEFVEIMLRFIYAKSINIPKLRGGKDVPAICVELCRLADFFLLDELAKVAKTVLREYLDERMEALDWYKTEIPTTLAEVFDSIRCAYKDNSTRHLRQMLLTFLWMRKDRYLQTPAIVALLDELPDFGKDLMKTSLSVDLKTSQPNKHQLHRSLLVLEAICDSGKAYSAGGPSLAPRRIGVTHFRKPCVLHPQHARCWINELFRISNSATDDPEIEVNFLVPRPTRVSTIYSNENSSIVQIVSSGLSRRNDTTHARFVCPADAKHYVDRYRKAVDGLKDKKKTAQQLEKELEDARNALFLGPKTAVRDGH